MKKLDFVKMREVMVYNHIASCGIKQKSILDVFKQVPRHCFVPEEQIASAYNNHPLAIGWGQTISQPYMVALMTKELELQSKMTVLEVGTGSGYQAAILAALGAEVYSLERIPQLAAQAKKTLDLLGYPVTIKLADGSLGWPEQAPYDRVIITAAVDSIPKPLIKQLKIGGRLIAPVGKPQQELMVVDKISDSKLEQKKVCDCVFVPLISESVDEN